MLKITLAAIVLTAATLVIAPEWRQWLAVNGSAAAPAYAAAPAPTIGRKQIPLTNLEGPVTTKLCKMAI